MKPIDHLRQLHLAAQQARHPNMPIHTLPPFRVTGNAERKELKKIAAFINLSGGIAQITNSSARRVDNRRTYIDGVGFARVIGSVEYRKNDLRPGTSDLTATYKGKSLAIELKRVYKNGRDRQSPAQKMFQADHERAGGIYRIVESFEDFYHWFVKL